MKSSRANGLRGVLALALLTGAATAEAQTLPGSLTPNAGEKPLVLVVGTRIVAEDGRVLSEPAKEVKVEQGQPLDRAKVAQSLRLAISHWKLCGPARGDCCRVRRSAAGFYRARKSLLQPGAD